MINWNSSLIKRPSIQNFRISLAGGFQCGQGYQMVQTKVGAGVETGGPGGREGGRDGTNQYWEITSDRVKGADCRQTISNWANELLHSPVSDIDWEASDSLPTVVKSSVDSPLASNFAGPSSVMRRSSKELTKLLLKFSPDSGVFSGCFSNEVRETSLQLCTDGSTGVSMILNKGPDGLQLYESLDILHLSKIAGKSCAE